MAGIINFKLNHFIYNQHHFTCHRYDQKAGATGQSRSLADEAKNTELANLKNEQEEMEKEKKIEADEEEELARSRQQDDWKDDHRRGWGNRHNMG